MNHAPALIAKWKKKNARTIRWASDWTGSCCWDVRWRDPPHSSLPSPPWQLQACSSWTSPTFIREKWAFKWSGLVSGSVRLVYCCCTYPFHIAIQAEDVEDPVRVYFNRIQAVDHDHRWVCMCAIFTWGRRRGTVLSAVALTGSTAPRTTHGRPHPSAFVGSTIALFLVSMITTWESTNDKQTTWGGGCGQVRSKQTFYTPFT